MSSKDGDNGAEMDRNIALFERIKQIALHHGDLTRGVRGTSSCYSVDVFNFLDPDDRIEMHYGKTSKVRDERLGEFQDTPPDMQFPVVIFYWLCSMQNRQVRTPYGILPNYAIGNDNKFYMFEQKYFLSATGQAVRYEEVIDFPKETLEKSLWEAELKEQDVLRLEFAPNVADTGWVELDEADRTLIETILNGIDKGEFVYPLGE